MVAMVIKTWRAEVGFSKMLSKSRYCCFITQGRAHFRMAYSTKKGVALNCHDPDGNTLLHLAIMQKATRRLENAFFNKKWM